MTTIQNEAVRELKSKVSGQVLLPSEPGYDEARTVWNAMIDRRPAVIVRCVSAQDVIHAVRTAREQKLVLAVRGGGHNIAGNAVCDGGLMIDLTPMKAVRVDAERRIGRVEPGADSTNGMNPCSPWTGGLSSSIREKSSLWNGGPKHSHRPHGTRLLHPSLLTGRQACRCHSVKHTKSGLLPACARIACTSLQARWIGLSIKTPRPPLASNSQSTALTLQSIAFPASHL